MDKINWHEPCFEGDELVGVKEVLESGYVSEGEKTKELEWKLAKFLGCKHVIMTTSGTAALYLAIEADKRLRGYIQGDVTIPSLTFVATKNAVEMAGLNPVCVDVDENFTMKNIIYNDPQTMPKIVIPVNLLGKAVNPKVIETCRERKITVICDNAGALGSEVPLGDVGCYSLQANKMISCGQGGFCATNSDKFAKEIRKIKDWGREDKYDNSTSGFNFKFNDILAAVALGQLDTIYDRIKRHKEIYEMYNEELEGVVQFDIKNGEVPLWVAYKTPRRDELFEDLEECDILARKPWTPLEDLENSTDYVQHHLWLPTGMHLTDDDIMEIIISIQVFNEIKTDSQG